MVVLVGCWLCPMMCRQRVDLFYIWSVHGDSWRLNLLPSDAVLVRFLADDCYVRLHWSFHTWNVRFHLLCLCTFCRLVKSQGPHSTTSIVVDLLDDKSHTSTTSCTLLSSIIRAFFNLKTFSHLFTLHKYLAPVISRISGLAYVFASFGYFLSQAANFPISVCFVFFCFT